MYDPISVSTAVVSSNGDLLIELTDGNVINAGRVVGSPGPKGDRGEEGIRGSAGKDGIDGTNGAKWHTGVGAPDVGLGANGDLYMDVASSLLPIWQKVNGDWLFLANLKPTAQACIWRWQKVQQVVVAPSSSTLAPHLHPPTTTATKSTKVTSGSTSTATTFTSITTASGLKSQPAQPVMAVVRMITSSVRATPCMEICFSSGTKRQMTMIIYSLFAQTTPITPNNATSQRRLSRI